MFHRRWVFAAAALASLVSRAAAAAPVEPDRPSTSPPSWEGRHVVDGNLAAALVGRYGLSYQFLPLRHHALVATLYRQEQGLASLYNDRLVGAGGELGWRVYSDARAASGFFLGPSVLGSTHTTTRTRWFGSYGLAVDAGYSFMLPPARIGRTSGKFHVAFGVGLQVLRSAIDRSALPALANVLVGTGLAPRVALTVGQAF